MACCGQSRNRPVWWIITTGTVASQIMTWVATYTGVWTYPTTLVPYIVLDMIIATFLVLEHSRLGYRQAILSICSAVNISVLFMDVTIGTHLVHGARFELIVFAIALLQVLIGWRDLKESGKCIYYKARRKVKYGYARDRK